MKLSQTQKKKKYIYIYIYMKNIFENYFILKQTNKIKYGLT